jgi:hypothetical protein
VWACGSITRACSVARHTTGLTRAVATGKAQTTGRRPTAPT